EGRCYEIDARLRPSGNQGTLVTSLASFRRYHAEGSQNWERQALLRARPIAGDEQPASAFDAARLEVLGRPAQQLQDRPARLSSLGCAAMRRAGLRGGGLRRVRFGGCGSSVR
ncbi:MAG: bifunctional glutamine synthetase adenylyltransferase/deadenyltransferase, partial [Gemmatimonadetes bacterium]|nr:bifunctional glutamine synthetase adenylyltransferase/deadenyltransferase [Gemmatimonadota bacterium]